MKLPSFAPAALLAHLRAWWQARQFQRARHARARYVAALLLKELRRMHELRYRITHGKRKDTVLTVRFALPLILTREELFCSIDTAHLPPNVKTTDLQKEEILQSLSDRAGSTVRLTKLANGQVCFATRLSGATFPAVFPINSYQMPADAPPLAIPLGIDGEGQHGYVDLATLPHLLIIGPTGKGKSTLIHALLTRWIERNSADELELWLADHKGGAELNRYTALQPKRGQRGIVQRFSYQPETTIEFLTLARKEMQRRLELMRQQDASDSDDYARITGQPMRRVVVVIDEIVNLMLNREKVDRYTIGKYAEALLVELASQGRAAGVHLVISTQVIKSDVLTSLIKANFESRICFGVADHWQSLTAIDDSRAAGLPIGRIILKREGNFTEYQSPLIKPQQVRMLLDRIAKYGPDGGLGEASEANRFRDDALLLVKVAAEFFEGKFSQREMTHHPQIKGVLTWGRVEEVARRLQKDGVLIRGTGNKPRKLAPLIYSNPDLIYSMYGAVKGVKGEDDITPHHSHITPHHSPCEVSEVIQQDAENPAPAVKCEGAEAGTFDSHRASAESDLGADIESQMAATLTDIHDLLSEQPDLIEEIPGPFRQLFTSASAPPPQPAPKALPAPRRRRNLFAREEPPQ